MIQVNSYIRVAESEISKGAVELSHQIEDLRRQKSRIENESRQRVHQLHAAMLHNLALISKEQNQQAKAAEERTLFKLRSDIKKVSHDAELDVHKLDQVIHAKEQALGQLNSLASSMRSMEASPALR